MIKINVTVTAQGKREINRLNKNLQVGLLQVMPREIVTIGSKDLKEKMQLFAPKGLTGDLRQGIQYRTLGKGAGTLATGKVFVVKAQEQKALENELGTEQVQYYRLKQQVSGYAQRKRVSARIPQRIDWKARLWVEKSPKLTEDLRQSILRTGVLRVGYPNTTHLGTENKFVQPTFEYFKRVGFSFVLKRAVQETVNKIIKQKR